MCGIVGIIKKDWSKTFSKDELGVFKQLLYADALRGWDSTGVIAVKPGNKVYTKKAATQAINFLHEANKTDIFHNTSILIGHNRAATKGNISDKNAHPFKENHITLVHNGTLYWHHYLANTDVDSHAITIALSKQDKTTVLSSLSGAYALVWYNEKEKRIYFICDDKRPIHALETKEFYVLVSEKELANWILARNNIEITTTFEINDFDLHYIDNNGLFYLETITPKKDWVFSNTSSEKDIKIGSEIKFISDKIEHLSYKAWGDHDWRVTGWLEEDPNSKVELYLNEKIDIDNKLLTVKVKSSYTNYFRNQQISTVISTELIKSEEFLEGDYDDEIEYIDVEEEEETAKFTLNNIPISQETVDKIKEHWCQICGIDFDHHNLPKSKLIPVWGGKPGRKKVQHYMYVCPGCIDIYEEIIPGHAAV